MLGRGKPVPLRHDDGGDAQDADDGEVDEPRLWGAVEGVVEPGHEAPHDQQGVGNEGTKRMRKGV